MRSFDWVLRLRFFLVFFEVIKQCFSLYFHLCKAQQSNFLLSLCCLFFKHPLIFLGQVGCEFGWFVVHFVEFGVHFQRHSICQHILMHVRNAVEFGCFNPIPFWRGLMALITCMMLRCFCLTRLTKSSAILGLLSHFSHWRRVSNSIIQSGVVAAFLKCFLFFSICCPLSDQIVRNSTSNIPAYSFAINLPLRMPPDNFVLGKDRWLWRLKSILNSVARAFKSFASLESGPHC